MAGPSQEVKYNAEFKENVTLFTATWNIGQQPSIHLSPLLSALALSMP